MAGLKFSMRNGGDTGKVVGPSHNQGGKKVQDMNGNPVAEIEGGERIFSIEHTQELELKANEISQFLADDRQDEANDLATALGYRVVEMIADQETINPS